MKYVGSELDLFSQADQWKAYYSSILRPYMKGRVLDVGCGMGVNAEYLLTDDVSKYTFLEPDPELVARINEHVRHPMLVSAEKICGTTSEIQKEMFNTILYLDVIEHIEDSAGELERAFRLLQPGGHLIIVVPAFNLLFSEFDKAIGHYRRYRRSLLFAELPPGMELVLSKYLDCVGMLMSLANRALLKQEAPTSSQIHFWDKRIVPISRVLDRLVNYSFGRSLVAVARRPLD